MRYNASGRMIYRFKSGSKLPLRIQGYCRHSQQYPRRGKNELFIMIHYFRKKQ